MIVILNELASWVEFFYPALILSYAFTCLVSFLTVVTVFVLLSMFGPPYRKGK